MSATMSADRFRECLSILHWSQRGLAEILYCDDRLVTADVTGVPDGMATFTGRLDSEPPAGPRRQPAPVRVRPAARRLDRGRAGRAIGADRPAPARLASGAA